MRIKLSDRAPSECVRRLVRRLLLACSAIALLAVVAIQPALAQGICKKLSYAYSSAGTKPDSCWETQQRDAGLCYNYCKAGYSGVGPVCWQNCPSGYVDTGAFCHINKPLTAAVSWTCGSSSWGICWWWKTTCPSGYTNAGLFCALNTPPVPAGWSGLTGLDIVKGSYGRGVGLVPNSCGAKTIVQDGLGGTLCHDCKKGYAQVGATCMSLCPSSHPNDCGGACATTRELCAAYKLNPAPTLYGNCPVSTN
jgi:hypothetical protein